MCNLKNQRKNTSPSITDVKVCVSSVSYLTEAAHMADKKDSEKKAFNWKVVGTASFVVLTAIGIGTAAWGAILTLSYQSKAVEFTSLLLHSIEG